MIVLGLMSGTSMDGIDAAVADLDLAGDTLRLHPLGHHRVAYSPGLRAGLAAALPPAPTSMEAVCRLHTGVGREFAAAAERALHTVSADGPAELVVSHGQTVFHWVDGGRVKGTLQLGAPSWIAERTGLPVVSDLRSADVAAGGQGAPLVSLFDVLLLGPGPSTRAALNLGGISNLTVVGPAHPPVAYDAGPANALLDAAAARLTGGESACDRDGEGAARGRVDEALLAALHDDAYYRRPPPKTTGKEHFHGGYLDAVLARVGSVAPEDLLATLTVHAAEVVAAECARHEVDEVIASGGGTENPVLMKILADRLGDIRLRRVDELGIPSAAKEAYAFAVLGYLSFCGLAGTLPACTGARRPVILGSISPGTGPLRLPAPSEVPPSRLVVAS